VGAKPKHCDPADEADWFRGDPWDFLAFDPDHRLVLHVVVGKRLAENAELLLERVRGQLGGRVPELITSDEFAAYEAAILAVFGAWSVPPRTGRPGRPAGPRVGPPAGMRYATVHKTRQRGRVVRVESREVFGAGAGADAGPPPASTSYLERQHATDRHRNARKARKTYRFSKDWEVHTALTAFTLYSDNFCWPVRTLRRRSAAGRWQPRTPAMAAGLTDHVWSWQEWLTLPAVQRK
jgi:hypothetical protein